MNLYTLTLKVSDAFNGHRRVQRSPARLSWKSTSESWPRGLGTMMLNEQHSSTCLMDPGSREWLTHSSKRHRQ